MYPRLVTVKGNAKKRGNQLAEQLSFEISSLLDHKKSKYKSLMSKIQPRLESFYQSVKTHTPICFQELDSLANALKINIYDLFLLSFEYEAWIKEPKEKCTGFYSQDHLGNIVMGQTNDEDPEDWFSAKYDKVIHLTDENENKCLIYTHPGIPAYMGINSHKLIVLWQYVDNGERNFETGVPTTALIRELISKPTLDSAIEFLKEVPRALPNNFIIGQEGVGGVNIECTPSTFTVKTLQQESFCHANHFLIDPKLIKVDVGVKNPDSTSLRRQHEIDSHLPSSKAGISIEEAKSILDKHPITYSRTLASMVFAPLSNEMHIRFKGSPSGYEVYKL